MSKRLLEVKALILQLLQQEEDMSSLPIGDKSSVDDIQVYLPNISKKDFKAALGALYKEGLVKPADDMIRLMTADEKQEIVSKFKIERDEEFTLFVGNLPAVETEKLKEAIEKAIAPKQLVSLRHIKGPDGTMKHFAYLQLHSKQDMEDVKLQLKGFEIQNRILRIDYANSNKKEEERQSKQSSSVPAASKMNSVDDSLILNASTSPATTAAASPSSSPSSRSSTGRKEYFFPVYVGNLSYKVTEQEIQIFFEKQLQRNVIRKIRLATHPDGEKRGFAYVDVGSEEDYEDVSEF